MFALTHRGKRFVIMNISEAAANTALDAIGELMNGGSIEILSGEGSPLAVLKLSDPAAMPAVGNELELNEIREDAAFANGTATAARIVGRDGSEVFTCDCGDENSDAVIKLTPVEITRDAPVRISSFRLGIRTGVANGRL
jgi:hypothetical protein